MSNDIKNSTKKRWSTSDLIKMFNASCTLLPRIISATNLALIGDTRRPLAIAFASIFLTS